MNVPDRLKMARESLGKNQKEMAVLLGIGYRSWQGYENGSHYPGGEVFEGLVRLGFSGNWLLAGDGSMRRDEGHQHANGNGIIQSHHIDAEELHIDIHPPGFVHEKHGGYAAVDPVEAAFLNDWRSVSDVAKMRVWTMLKEEKAREGEGKK